MNVPGFGLYRRSDIRPATPPVPPVLPQVDVTVDELGRIHVHVDGEPHPCGDLERDALQGVVEQIATKLESAIRVNLREVDGTQFVDIVTPPTGPTPDPINASIHAAAATGELAASGFRPGEPVMVAVIVAREVADADGTARLRLPPALLAAHQDALLLIGETTGLPRTHAGAA